MGDDVPFYPETQRHGLCTIIKSNPSAKILEDFNHLQYTAYDLSLMDIADFRQVFEHTFLPLNQIALNMGFETWT